MKSEIVTIRLRADEKEQLREICLSEVRGDLNVCEMFRLLIKREWNRRKGLPAPQASEYQSAFRNGRPKQEQEPNA